MGKELTRQSVTNLLKKYGVKIVEESLARSPAQAASSAKKIGYPVALKIVSKEISHKTDSGCVKTNIMNERELSTAYAQIIHNAGKAKYEGVLVQRMVKHGIELIIGGRKDPQFGPLVMFGLGGVFVEILRDVSVRVCPVTPTEATGMVNEIKGSPLLHGARGTVPVDVKELALLISGVSRMLHDHEGICELDLNPIIASPNGLLAVDVRVVACKA